jgi:hypothetical protein
MSGVVVASDVCHVKPATVTLTLTR